MAVSSPNVYARIKDQVTTRAAAEFYGHKVNRQGMMLCPFHYDTAPSMKVDENFICFGCQEKGDVIAFVEKLFGLGPYEAALKLAKDFGINIPAQKKVKAASASARFIKLIQMDRKSFDKAIDYVFNTYCDYLYLLRSWEKEYMPGSPADDFHPLYIEACQQKEPVEIILDILIFGSGDDKAFVLIEKGEEVSDLEKRIQEYKSGTR